MMLSAACPRSCARKGGAGHGVARVEDRISGELAEALDGVIAPEPMKRYGRFTMINGGKS